MRKDFHFQCNLKETKAKKNRWLKMTVFSLSLSFFTSIDIVMLLMLIVIVICSVMLLECFLMRDLVIVVSMFTMLRVLIKVYMIF